MLVPPVRHFPSEGIHLLFYALFICQPCLNCLCPTTYGYIVRILCCYLLPRCSTYLPTSTYGIRVAVSFRSTTNQRSYSDDAARFPPVFHGSLESAIFVEWYMKTDRKGRMHYYAPESYNNRAFIRFFVRSIHYSWHIIIIVLNKQDDRPCWMRGYPGEICLNKYRRLK